LWLSQILSDVELDSPIVLHGGQQVAGTHDREGREMSGNDAPEQNGAGRLTVRDHGFYRFHLPHAHVSSVFGDDWFALKAEAFARFFGTPVFLVAQTVIVGIWILVNIAGWWIFDQYPFILLNLAFSLQAAYAAPLILLAQTRQADRDKVTTMADAQHREALHEASEDRQRVAAEQTALLVRMLEQNTQLTETAKMLAERIESLTTELHQHIIESSQD
jgi:uncharacterized membrane protein